MGENSTVEAAEDAFKDDGDDGGGNGGGGGGGMTVLVG